MLHELLLALVGFTGDFVIDVREHLQALNLPLKEILDNSSSFRLADDISFVQASERFLHFGIDLESFSVVFFALL